MKDLRREIWSFFSGAMGLDLGLEQAGLGATLVNDVNPVFCRTIRANRPDLDVLETDVSQLDASALRCRRQFDGDVHLMVGGPPCQSFSSGGKRAALSDPRGNLIYEYLRLISEVRPKYFILENVANLTTAALRHRPINERPGRHWSLKKYDDAIAGEEGLEPLAPDEMAGSALRQIMSDVSGLGYHLSLGVLDAADFGAPQHRLRFVMLGSRDLPQPPLPQPTHGSREVPHATVRDAIWHLQTAPGPHSEYTPAVFRFFELVPEGGNWRSLPLGLQRDALGGSYDAGGGKTGFYRRLAWDKPAPTITGRANRKGSALCHPAATRPLSVAECAAIQGFPTNWKFEGAMNSQYMQVGNAVPVPLGRAIGCALVAHDEARRHEVVARAIEDMVADATQRLRAAGRNKRSVRAA